MRKLPPMKRGDPARRFGALLMVNVALPGAAYYFIGQSLIRQLGELWTRQNMNMAGIVITSVVLIGVWALVMLQIPNLIAALWGPLFDNPAAK